MFGQPAWKVKHLAQKRLNLCEPVSFMNGLSRNLFETTIWASSKISNFVDFKYLSYLLRPPAKTVVVSLYTLNLLKSTKFCPPLDFLMRLRFLPFLLNQNQLVWEKLSTHCYKDTSKCSWFHIPQIAQQNSSKLSLKQLDEGDSNGMSFQGSAW